MIKSTPLISILLPCFNSQQWIGESLSSILKQSYNNIELLIYNDGSTDGTLDLINSFSKSSKKIKLINSDSNKGIVIALNELVKVSQGSYIARMDADDIAHPDRLQKQIDFISTSNTDLCGSWFTEIGGGPKRTTRWPTSHEAIEAALLFQNSICHPTVMAKRQVFDDFPYRNEFNFAEDYDFFIRAIQKYKFANIPEALLNYRRHPTQATQAKKEDMERVTKLIRISALANAGIYPTSEESRIHHLIRAPHSITNIQDLNSIEKWLFSLLRDSKSPEFNSVIASQWIRACIRAAPLGFSMIKKFQSSLLLKETEISLLTHIDIAAIATLRLDYNSGMFQALRRIGLSA